MPILNTHDSMILLVDMQVSLLPAIDQREQLLGRVGRLLQAAQLTGVPVIATEHWADKLGPTDDGLRPYVDHVIHKTHFDATREAHFSSELPRARHNILVVGTEAHVCVLQTGLGLAATGYAPRLITDCIGSRHPADAAAAIARWDHHRLERMTAEMAMFEWLETPEHPEFKAVLSLIKAN